MAGSRVPLLMCRALDVTGDLMSTAEMAGGTQVTAGEARIDFATHPNQYKHWKITIEGRVAKLALDVQENGALIPGYELKLNSYDLGVYTCEVDPENWTGR